MSSFEEWAKDNLPLNCDDKPYCTEEIDPSEIWKAAQADAEGQIEVLKSDRDYSVSMLERKDFEISKLQAANKVLRDALKIIAKRPDLPNPDRDADWKNCQKWSSHDAEKALKKVKLLEAGE